MTWRDEAEALPNFAPASFDIDAASTALVVVDMQYLDAHPDYGLGKQLKASHPDVWRYYTDRLQELVVPNCARLLSFFRAASMRVIFVTIGPVLPDGMDMVPLRRPRTARILEPYTLIPIRVSHWTSGLKTCAVNQSGRMYRSGTLALPCVTSSTPRTRRSSRALANP